jgi:hypothetical protein
MKYQYSSGSKSEGGLAVIMEVKRTRATVEYIIDGRVGMFFTVF